MMNRVQMAMVFAVLGIFVCSALVYAEEEYQIEILPTIIVGQSYDDNIFLSRDNNKSDWITTVSPGVIVQVDSAKTRLVLEYFPTLVWYKDLSENDTVRHRANLNLTQRFTKFLQLDLTERYLKTEDPFLEALDPSLRSQSVRHTRNVYQRNDVNATMQYQFARHDTASVGFLHSLLENDDPSLDDISYYGPTASLTHFFDVRNGVEFNYRYEIYDYSRETGTPLREDLTGHIGRVRYIHQFNPRTKAFVGYSLTSRHFDGSRQDYQVHEGRAGVEHQFERDWKLTLEGGGFDPTSGAGSDGGAVFSARLDRQLKLGKFMVGFDTGWDEGFLESTARGFTQYYSFKARGEYQILQKLFGSFDAFYRENDRPDNGLGFSDDFSLLYAAAGLKYEIYKRIFLGLEYAYLEKDADNNFDDFKDNRVLLTLSASYALMSPDRKGIRRSAGSSGTSGAGTSGTTSTTGQ